MNKLQAYSKYKESGFEWINEIPNHWNVKRLKNVSNVQLSNIDKKSVEGEKEVLLCNYVDVYYNHTIDHNIDFMKATAKDDQIKRLTLQKNDVLLTKDSETPDDIGVPTWVKENMEGVVCGYHLALVRPNNQEMNGRYLYYLLTSSGFRDQFWDSANGVTRYGISKGDIQNILLFIPPLKEQEQIAIFIDDKTSEIDSLITDKEKLIELLEEKRQAIITEAVTKGLNPNVKMKDSGVELIGQIPEHWDIKRIKHLSTYVGSGKTPKGGGEIYTNEGVMFLRSMNVHFDGLRLNDIVFINPEIDEDMKSTRVQSKDVLLNITGASIGRTCIVPGDFPSANVNQHVCIIRPARSGIVHALLAKIMGSQIVQEQILMAQNGSSREGLNFPQVRNLFFPLSNSIEEQGEISKHIENQTKEIYATMKEIQIQIVKLKEYRQALIYEATTGKMDVRDYKKVLS